jgi:hypothetical protein
MNGSTALELMKRGFKMRHSKWPSKCWMQCVKKEAGVWNIELFGTPSFTEKLPASILADLMSDDQWEVL